MASNSEAMAKVAPDKDAALAEGAAAKPKPPKKAPLSKMLSLASSAELAILGIGVAGALGNGLLQPLVIVMWGDMIDGLGAPVSGALHNPQNITAGSAADRAAEEAAYTDAANSAMQEDMNKKVVDILILGLFAILAGTIQGACFKKFAEAMQQKMLMQYYHVLLHQDVEWFDGKDPAALPLQMTSDSQAFGDAWGDKMGTSFMGISTFTAGYAIAFARGWPIALVMTGTLPFIAVGGIVMGEAMQSIQLETQGWYGVASAVAEECFYAIRTVVAFGGEPREIVKYSDAVGKARWGGVKNQVKVGAGLGYTMCMCFLSYALAFYFGMRLRYDNVDNPSTGKPWEPGEILSVFFCVLMGSFMIGTIDPGIKAFEAARISAARYFDAQDTLPVIQCRTQDLRKSLDAIQTMELKDVHFAYPARPDVAVLNGLSLSVKQGQKVAVVGESGSGKSTVMALLERFYDPQQGQILVNGESIQGYSITALRKCIGYVGQEPVLFATSIRENILQGAIDMTPEAANSLLEKVVVEAQLGFIETFPEKLNTYVGSGGLQMSGGQKQRIAIARALMKQASILFFDEATSALDNTSEKLIQETIDKLSSASNLTTLTIAHRLSTVRSSDMIFVLSRGTLAESGTHADLMAKQGLYYALVASQDAAMQGSQEGDTLIGLIKSISGEGLQRQLSPTQSSGAEGKRADGALISAMMVNDTEGKVERADEVEQQDAQEAERQKKILKEYKVPMSRLLFFCKKEWGFFIPGVLAALYDGASQPMTGILLVEAMYGFMLPKEEMRARLEEVSLYFVLLSVGELFACTISQACFGILGESLTMRLRVALFSKVFEQEMGYHDNPDNSPGSLTAALQIYAFRVQNLCTSISQKANAMSALVTGLTLGFVACWQMALILLGSVPITVAANMLQMVVMLGGASAENSKLKTAQQLVSESVQNVRTVHACGIEKRLSALYSGIVVSAKSPNSKHVLAGLALGVSGGVMFFIMGGAFYFMAEFIKNGTASYKDLMTSFMGIFFAAMGAGQAAGMMGDATKATVAAHDAFKVLDRQSQINGMKELGPTPEGNDFQPGAVCFEDVHFYYPFRPDVKVLKGVTFAVEQNTSVGLCGPSGGGKSTIMALLQRYYDPMSGLVSVGATSQDRAQDLSKINIRWWRQRVGFVGQEPILFNTTVRLNVLYGLPEGTTISEEKLEDCRRMSNIDFLNKDGGNGWDTEVGPRGSHLSGGQKQRVAICRALVRDPSVMLLDEATSALDSASEKVVQVALEEARRGRTSFAIAHRLSTISDCDIIMVVAEGVVLEKGNHSELMDMKGVYYKLQNQSQK